MKTLPLAKAILCFAFVSAALMPARAFVMRFDLAGFSCPGVLTNHLCQAQFEALNWKTNASHPVGHMVLMGSDTHRTEINNNGNFIGCYYNVLNENYPTFTATQKADDIQNWLTANFSSTGAVPKWVALNEISRSLWGSSSAYRVWVHDVLARLKNTYNHTCIVYSPFWAPTDGFNTDWHNISLVAYVGVENYLSGQQVNGSGNSVSWCQNMYQTSVTDYGNLGVPLSDLILVEQFSQSLAGADFGRAGVSYAGWDNAIHVRAQAAHNIGFAGYSTYGWSGNPMGTSDTDLVHFENTYVSQTLP
jgi:hypothetical protein